MSTAEGRWLLEIPVYRISPDEWEADVNARVAHRIEVGREMGDSKLGTDHQRSMEALAHRIERPFEWRYNEIVAWLRVRWDGGTAIKTYAWTVRRKRYRRGFAPHPFIDGYPLSKVAEMWVEGEIDNAAVTAELRADLARLTDPSGDFAGRHIDLEIFDIIAPHVDWRAILRQ